MKEELKLSLFASDMILYLVHPKYPTRKLQELINEFSKVEEYKIKCHKSNVFLFISDDSADREIRKTASFIKSLKNKIKYLGISSKKEMKDFYNEKYRTLKKELKKTLDNGKISHLLWKTE